MPRVLDPFWFLLIAASGWMNQHQVQMIEYLREENRVLREQLGDRRLRFTDDQRRRLAVKAKGLGRKLLLDRLIFFGEESLRTAVSQFVTHYHRERPHQGLGNRFLRPEPGPMGNTSVIQQ